MSTIFVMPQTASFYGCVTAPFVRTVACTETKIFIEREIRNQMGHSSHSYMPQHGRRGAIDSTANMVLSQIENAKNLISLG